MYSEISVQTLDQLFLAITTMLIFALGLLANYLFDLVYKSLERSFFFYKFSCGTPKVATSQQATSQQQQLTVEQSGGEGDSTLVTTTPPTSDASKAAGE